MTSVIVDVREKDEFDAEHVENSIHVPLSRFQEQAPALLHTLAANPEGKSVILMCQSGKRASLASAQAVRFSTPISIEVFHGGIQAWKTQGRPTVSTKRGHLPIMRQVQLVAGSLVLLGSLLAYFASPNFLVVTGFVGAGLIFAGASGFCGMAELLAKMPWNRS
jgi:rhodanese-related sulfurtransferase